MGSENFEYVVSELNPFTDKPEEKARFKIKRDALIFIGAYMDTYYEEPCINLVLSRKTLMPTKDPQ